MYHDTALSEYWCIEMSINWCFTYKSDGLARYITFKKTCDSANCIFVMAVAF